MVRIVFIVAGVALLAFLIKKYQVASGCCIMQQASDKKLDNPIDKQADDQDYPHLVSPTVPVV